MPYCKMTSVMLPRWQVLPQLLPWILITAATFVEFGCQARGSTSSKLPEAHVTKRRVIRMDGDIIIGALFPVHRQPPLKIAFTDQCGEFWEQYGIHRIEMFLRTLDEINNNPKILPNVTLGCDIRDSCWYSPVALERSIDFIKNSIASQETSNQTGQNAPGCPKKRVKPIAGLIGPGSSTVTIQVQNLLSLFHIPQIGYSATSLDLSDKQLYKYFLRVVPSDKLQARALLDVVRYFNWTYISTVYTEGNYGFSGMTEFQNMAAEEDIICEAVSDKVPNNAEDSAYDEVIMNLQKKPNARVVVCFCEGMTIRGLLFAVRRLGVEGKFLFIGSDGWNVRKDVVNEIEDVAEGGLSIKLYSPSIHDFNQHYFSLRPYNNSRNVWFREFWQERFHCYLPGPDKDNRFRRMCTGEESLAKGYEQDAKLGFVVNAMYTMAYALDTMRRDVCRDAPPGGLCPEMKPVNGTQFLDYLLNVSFTSYSGDSILFNQNGDPPGRYDIMNFQRVMTPNGSYVYDYVRIGGWDSGNLTISEKDIRWPGVKDNLKVVESVCSKPCAKGKVKQITQGGVHCCWVCTACKENEIVLDESTCRACPQGWRPNVNLSGCLMIDIEHIQWGDTEAVVAIGFACFGVLATMWVTLVFMRHNNTPVVKASTRELSYIILLGICVSYTTTFPLVAKPGLVSCYLTRILPGLSFSLIYGALVTKTNRIARILAGSKKKIMTRKPRFMSASAQVVITCIIIGIECAIITVMLILEPADSKLMYPLKTRVKLACNATTLGIIVPLGFDIFLIVMCTLYAIKTRNLPENFNEAKFIGFTMYTTCIIWLAFVPIYFGSDNKVITMCLAITLSASVALILLFFPKIYIIVCKPEKNARSAFTTSKDVRCHIGSTSANQSRSLSTSNDSTDRVYSGKVHPNKGGMTFFPWKSGSLDSSLAEAVKPKDPLKSRQNKERNEKTFENAALTLYRQKSFFNRWRNKSITADGEGQPEPAESRQGFGGRLGKAARQARPNSSGGGGSVDKGSQENIPLRGNSGQGSRDNRPRMIDSSLNNHRSTSFQVEHIAHAPAGAARMSGYAASSEQCTQTDDELLMPLLSGLRRRKRSHDQQNSSPSSYDNTQPSMVNGWRTTAALGGAAASAVNGGGAPDGRKHSRTSGTSSKGSQKSLDMFFSLRKQSATSATDSSETDLLLENEQEHAEGGHMESMLSPGQSENAPLLRGLPGASLDHSMLSGEDGFTCDSTSEEDLSEHDLLEPMEDLDELLSNAGQLQGSFASLNSLKLDFSPPSTAERSKKKTPCQEHNGGYVDLDLSQASVNLIDMTERSDGAHPRRLGESKESHFTFRDPYRDHNVQDPYNNTHHHNVSISDEFSNGASNSSREQSREISSAQTSCPGPLPFPSHHHQGSDGSQNIPSIQVDRASPSPANVPPPLGGASRPAPGGVMTTDFMEGPQIDRRASAISQSSTSSGECAEMLASLSPEELSLMGISRLDDEADSVAKFQDYLRTRGLDLDLSSVQSSDV